MMKLHELSPAPGSVKERKRIGRGAASGQGKTAGKGHKGQKARSGSNAHIGFEGGQMPLQRRIPKRGFVNIFAKEIATVNVAAINDKFDDGATVTIEALVESGLVKKTLDGVKVLGQGELTKKLTVQANAFSASAKAKIEAAGGKAEVIYNVQDFCQRMEDSGAQKEDSLHRSDNPYFQNRLRYSCSVHKHSR